MKQINERGAALRTGLFLSFRGNLPDLRCWFGIWAKRLSQVIKSYFIRQGRWRIWISLSIPKKEVRVLYFWLRFANSMLTLLFNIFTNLNLSDIETGFKVFRSEVIKQTHLKENRFGIEPEITVKLAKIKNCTYFRGWNTIFWQDVWRW